MRTRRRALEPDRYASVEAARLAAAWESIDHDRLTVYIDHMLKQAGWELKPRISDGCILGGSGGGLWFANFVDIEVGLTRAAEGRRLAITVKPRDLERGC